MKVRGAVLTVAPDYMHLVPVPGGQVLCWVMQYLLKVREEIHVASSLGLLL